MTKYILMILVASLFASPFTQAKAKILTPEEREELVLRIRKGSQISVYAYVKETDSYLITIVRASAIGPNVTSPDFLVDALDNGMTVASLKKNPNSIVGAEFTTKKVLYLLSDDELHDRQVSHTK